MNLDKVCYMIVITTVILGLALSLFQAANISVLKGEVVSISQPFSTYDSNYHAHVVVHIDYLQRNVTIDVHCDLLQAGSNVQIQYIPATLFLPEWFSFIGQPNGC